MSAAASGSQKISPTAYATGQFWIRHGLSPRSLETPQGRRLDHGFRVLMGAIRRVSGISLEAMMLARHRGIDDRLKAAIDARQVGQVIEIAAGLSGRGARFTQRYGLRLTYVETDLPDMAGVKRRLLDAARLSSPGHRVVTLDALADAGPFSLAEVAASLNPHIGTAIITEGLMNYLAPADARAVWQRIARVLGGFSTGIYLCDVYPGRARSGVAMRAFRTVIELFVRGRMHVHFASAEEAAETLETAGFATVAVHGISELEATRALAGTAGAERVSILEARSR